METTNGWKCGKLRVTHRVTLRLTRGKRAEIRAVDMVFDRRLFEQTRKEAEEQAKRICEAFAEVLNDSLPDDG